MTRYIKETVAFSLTLILFGTFAAAQQAEVSESTAADSTSAEIQKVSNAFAEAYNSRNADGIADLFIKDGEYVSVSKEVYSGQDSIRDEFKAGFAAVKGKKLSVTSDSVRKLSPTLAVEDGTATVTGPDGSVFISDYCAVFTKGDSGWKIASLRDLESVPATPGENLLQLKWIVGEWVSESSEGVVEHEYYWSEDGNFILGSFRVVVDGKPAISGTRRLGWDAQQQVIRGWTFDSEGGHSSGTWHETDNGWMIRARGITADGKTGTSINYYEFDENKKLTWRSTNRVIDGRQTDPIEIKFVKQPPRPASSKNQEEK